MLAREGWYAWIQRAVNAASSAGSLSLLRGLASQSGTMHASFCVVCFHREHDPDRWICSRTWPTILVFFLLFFSLRHTPPPPFSSRCLFLLLFLSLSLSVSVSSIRSFFPSLAHLAASSSPFALKEEKRCRSFSNPPSRTTRPKILRGTRGMRRMITYIEPEGRLARRISLLSVRSALSTGFGRILRGCLSAETRSIVDSSSCLRRSPPSLPPRLFLRSR